MSNRFKTVSNTVKTRNRISKFIIGNSDESKATEKLIKFANKHHITLSTTIEEYERKEIRKNEVIGATLYRLGSLITALRFFMSSVFNTETMIGIMCDPNYLLTNQRVFSMIVCLAALVILFIGLLLQINEIRYKWYLLTFIHDWKHRRLLPLTAKNRKKLAMIINLMAKLLMKQAFWPLVGLTSILLIGFSFVAYFQQKYQMFVIPLIFFDVCLYVWELQFYCIVCAGFVAWSVPMFYLKFKFKEIHAMMKRCVKYNNMRALKTAISQHNALSVQTKLVDDVYRFVIFILYYVGSPALMLLLYLSHSKDTVYFVRPILIFILSMVYFVVFYLNLVSAQISHSAAKPRTLMFKLVIEHDLKIKDRIKIMQFIEKLSGPDIGFHCWNLFPMNNYTFYQYVASCACTYFLLLGLIQSGDL